jgi:putative FmdB family regulatory protein
LQYNPGMPMYDFVCLNCKRPFEVFLSFSEYGQKPVQCAHCGSGQVRRKLSKVRIARSEESRMDGMLDDSSLSGLEDDPQAMGRMLKKMSREMGEDLPPEFDEVTDRLESGQSPEEIESALPDPGTEGAAAGED